MNDNIFSSEIETLPVGLSPEFLPGFAPVEPPVASDRKKQRSGSREKHDEEAAKELKPVAISGDNSGAPTVSGDVPLGYVSGDKSAEHNQALSVSASGTSRAFMPDSSTKSPETSPDLRNRHLSGDNMAVPDARISKSLSVDISVESRPDQSPSPEATTAARKLKGKKTKKHGKSRAQLNRDDVKERGEFAREDVLVRMSMFAFALKNSGDGRRFESRRAAYLWLLDLGYAAVTERNIN